MSVREPTPPMIEFRRLTLDGRPEPPAFLQREDVHLWGFSLDLEAGFAQHVQAWLSEEERYRASRLLSATHRRQFVAAHGALRVILSRYCCTRPEELRIGRTSSGKPCLMETRSQDCHRLTFNLTHSHGRGLLAVSRDREVGVDLESIRPAMDMVRLARRFFSPQDQAFILNGESAGRCQRFLQVWVAKEAAAKAEGTGISFPLSHHHLQFHGNGLEGRVVPHRGGAVHSEQADDDIMVRFLPLERDWAGAVAAKGSDWRWIMASAEGEPSG